MGCICSKELCLKCDDQQEAYMSELQYLPATKREEKNGYGLGLGSLSGFHRAPSKLNLGPLGNGYSSTVGNKNVEDDNEGKNVKSIILEKPPSRGSHHRRATVDLGVNGGQKPMNRIISMPRVAHGEEVIEGWPSWLTSVASEAIQGWVPRRADSFEKLDKIGQGTYSNVYKARDLETGKFVAMKKVRFLNMDPESVRFMAREIHVLRKLDHPNIIKLEGLVTSRMSESLYLIFEYMDHDLAGLLAKPANKFTQPQIKCIMQQLLYGLEHCHSRGVLHRDIKGSNLLIDKNGVLKIGDFGLATNFKPGQNQPLTSHVVTLWYRAPELLLGSTEYGVAVDLWSVGCILAELFIGKPIMPGRTEVEQMHKIFKLCGSPSESYWRNTKLPHATSFIPSQPYKRRLMEAFKEIPIPALALLDALLSIEPEKRGTALTTLNSEFFTTQPLPCDPSTLPKYPPTKEIDIKLQNAEARRQITEAMKGRATESVRSNLRDSKPTMEYYADGDLSLTGWNSSNTYNAQGNIMTFYTVNARRPNMENVQSHCNTTVHQGVVRSLKNDKAKKDQNDDDNHAHNVHERTGHDSRSRNLVVAHGEVDFNNKDNGYILKTNKMRHSGPLVPTGANLENMLKEHERQIQQAVRKSRIEKERNKTHDDIVAVRLMSSIV